MSAAPGLPVHPTPRGFLPGFQSLVSSVLPGGGLWAAACVVAVCFHIPVQSGASPTPATQREGGRAGRGAPAPPPSPYPRYRSTQYQQGAPTATQGPASIYLWHPAAGLRPRGLCRQGPAPVTPTQPATRTVTVVLNGQQLLVPSYTWLWLWPG